MSRNGGNASLLAALMHHIAMADVMLEKHACSIHALRRHIERILDPLAPNLLWKQLKEKENVTDPVIC